MCVVLPSRRDGKLHYGLYIPNISTHAEIALDDKNMPVGVLDSVLSLTIKATLSASF